MSYKSLFRRIIPRLLQQEWGRKIKLPDGTKQDTGVSEFVEELAAALSNARAIELDEPIVFNRNFDGPAIQFRDASDASIAIMQHVAADGTVTDIPVVASSTVLTSSLVQQLTLVEIGVETLVAEKTGGARITVDKPYKLRASTAVGPSGVTYASTGPQSRTASDGTNTESQVIVPQYRIGDLIYVADYQGPANSRRYIDLNVDGRAWAEASS